MHCHKNGPWMSLNAGMEDEKGGRVQFLERAQYQLGSTIIHQSPVIQSRWPLIQSSITSWVNHVTSAHKLSTVLGQENGQCPQNRHKGKGEWQASGRGLKANMALAIGKGLVSS